MSMPVKLRALAIALTAGLSCIPLAATAQDVAADAGDTALKGGLEDIIVTARRKTENLTAQ
jgi:hypothetical protein